MTDMTLQDKIVKLFFGCMPVEQILAAGIDADNFPRERLIELLRCYHPEYSDTEADLISRYHLDLTKGHNVCQTLINVASDLLSVRNSRVCCRYEKILRWRDVSGELGEDLLICAYLLDSWTKTGRECIDFNWNIVLGHDNKQLNAIMKEGISDNHFHLFGSAPIFPMIWIRMMNNIQHGKYLAGLMGIEKKRRHFQYDLGTAQERFSTRTLILTAALMRAVMYEALRMDMSTENQTKDTTDFWNRELCRYLFLLQRGNQIVHGREEIREFIQKLRLRTLTADGELLQDYALRGSREPGEYSNWLFSGERKLIYYMLCDILITRRLPAQVRRLLYPYLVIRTWFRKEFVQNNENIGFENFSVYSRRKGYFLPTNPTAKEKRLFWESKEREQNLEWMVQHAVLESFQTKNLKSLEIRISPEKDFAANVRQIETYDKLLCGKEGEGKILSLDRFFYVIHFAKKADETEQKDVIRRCRHARLRKDLMRKANAILKIRRLRPEIARRIRGIDACAMEIGCRPEVFACAFRKLRMDVPSIYDMETERYVIRKYMKQDIGGRALEKRIPQLSVTYHAGEDFLDPVDGLRALDEAIRFLDMGAGDRFGHATVLGLDLKKWYVKKSFLIHLAEQDYLDNVMWFYMMIQEFQLEGCEILKDHLYQEFRESFSRIYGTDDQILKSTSGERTAEYTSIYTYYEAWKLRDDVPEFYKSGKYQEPDILKEGRNLFPPTCRDASDVRERENSQTANLYFRYHFDQEVKNNGKRVLEKRIPEMYVQGVLKLQKCMQEKIAQKGIGIECNPSSNLAISTMDSYDEHPILNLYTLGLGDNREIAQMFVSINTDDRGLFHTSLENEYALLASSVESLRNENGKKIYTPQAVYEWLNHIRVMGNQQVF